MGGVLAFVSLLYAEVQGREEEVGFGLGRSEGNSWLEAAGQRDHVAVFADSVIDVRGEDVHLRARRIDGAEVEGVREKADDRVGRVAEGDGLADDVGVAVELPLPEGVAEDDNRGAAGAGFFRGEGQAAHQWLHAPGI